VSKSPDTGRLTKLDRFSDLSDAEVALIASRGTQVHLPADWSLIWERTPADKAYIILRGEVSVRRKGQEIARLGPGDTVGEAAIVGHKLRNASVVSLTELDVLHFTSEAVRQLLEEVPSFRTALEQTMRERLAETPAS
jgi:CRP-like cAMP-binding protein